jgi:hypothetical protein
MTTTTASGFSLPYLNLNGTSPAAIEDEYAEAAMLVRKARQAVAVCTCHPRDFQFQNPSAFNQARSEREHVLRQLDDIESYLDAWYWSAVDQNPEHNK